MQFLICSLNFDKTVCDRLLPEQRFPTCRRLFAHVRHSLQITWCVACGNSVHVSRSYRSGAFPLVFAHATGAEEFPEIGSDGC